MVTIIKDEIDEKKVKVIIDCQTNKRLADVTFKHAVQCSETNTPMMLAKEGTPFDLLVSACEIQKTEMLSEYPNHSYVYALVLKGEILNDR